MSQFSFWIFHLKEVRGTLSFFVPLLQESVSCVTPRKKHSFVYSSSLEDNACSSSSQGPSPGECGGLGGREGCFWPEGSTPRLNLPKCGRFTHLREEVSMRQNDTCYFESVQATHLGCTSRNPCRRLAARVGSFSRPPHPPPLLGEGTLRCLLGCEGCRW